MHPREVIMLGSPHRNIAVATALVLVMSTTAAAAAEQQLARESFRVPAAGTLTVTSELGSVEVLAGSSGEVSVVVTADDGRLTEREFRRFRDDFKVEFSQTAAGVQITATYAGRRSGWFGTWATPKVLFAATVPPQFAADIRTGGGGITIERLHGDVRARTSGGSLRFGQLGGSVWGRTSGGSISLDRCAESADVHTSGGSITIGESGGSVTANTSGGSIRIQRARGDVVARTSGGGIKVEEVMGSIDASTSGGSIEASISAQPAADCRLTTSGGSVTVTLDPTVAVTVDARGNRVRSDLPITATGELGGGRLAGTLNGGGPTLTLRTSGGSVRILTR